jgi:hypothetical protein
VQSVLLSVVSIWIEPKSVCRMMHFFFLEHFLSISFPQCNNPNLN